MASPHVGLSPEHLAQVFPYHLVLDAALRVRQVGGGLARLDEAIAPGDPLAAHFRVVTPAHADHAALRAQAGGVVTLDSNRKAFQLAGRLVDLGADQGLLLLVEPRPTGGATLAPPPLSSGRGHATRAERHARDATQRVLEAAALALAAEPVGDVATLLGGIAGTAQEALTALDDAADLAAADAAKLMLVEAPFRLRATLGLAVRGSGRRASEKDVELVLQVAPDVPDNLVGDAERLGRVVRGLADRAVRATERGEIVVRVALVEAAGAAALLRVEVSDTGAALTPDRIAALWDGDDLDLAVCARLVALMGGQVWAYDDAGRGSSLGFKAHFGLGPQAATRPPPSLAGVSVLVADDSAASRAVVADALRQWGMRPVIADDGPSALAALRSAAQGAAPVALAVLDAEMPVVGGVALARQMHDDPTLHRVPVVLLRTAPLPNDAPEPVPGVAASVTKPVSGPELQAAVRAALGLDPEETCAAATARALDHAAMLSRVDGNRELLEGLVRLFLQRSPRMLARLRRCVAQRDARSLEREAHTLRGLLANLAADAAAHDALRLERLASGGDLDAAGEVLAALERGVHRLRPGFAELARAARPRQVLVAEDEVVSRRMLEATLRHGGYDVVVARDGAEAWQVLQGDDAPRLAVLDWLMPGLDGAAVCRRLRARQREPYTYVIMVTGRSRREDVVNGLEAGADDFLTKPYDPQELRSRLRVGERILAREARHADALAELRDELAQVPHLQGLLPICMYCKRLRDDHHAWHRLEEYIERNSQTTFTHSLCERCLETHFHE